MSPLVLVSISITFNVRINSLGATERAIQGMNYPNIGRGWKRVTWAGVTSRGDQPVLRIRRVDQTQIRLRRPDDMSETQTSYID